MRIVVDLRAWRNNKFFEQFYFNLCKQLAQKDHFKFLLIVYPSQLLESAVANIKVFTVPKENPGIIARVQQKKSVKDATHDFQPHLVLGNLNILSEYKNYTQAKKLIVIPEIPNAKNNIFSFVTGKTPLGSITKASSIIVPFSLTKKVLLENYHFGAENVHTIPLAVPNNVEVIDWKQKEELKEQYTDGYEYFYFSGNFSNEAIWIVLKAFSGFKKWQRSNMKLVVTDNNVPEKSLERLSNYRYRKDVKVIPTPGSNGLNNLVASAYAVINTDDGINAAWLAVYCLQCRVPFITTNHTKVREVANEAALYVEAFETEAIALHMKNIYKDEVMRLDLLDKGEKQVKANDWHLVIQQYAELFTSISGNV